ncbi:MAG: DUF6491 family protein [Pseudomonadota bacterium]
MKLLKSLCVASLSTAALACASAGGGYEISERTAARLAEFDKTGETQSCINTRRINTITALDERHFLVRVGVNDYYLNKLSNSCNGADRQSNRLQYATSIAQLCSNQIVNVVDNSSGFTVGSCGLSKFEKLERKPAE